jgi:hypothetical protein
MTPSKFQAGDLVKITDAESELRGAVGRIQYCSLDISSGVIEYDVVGINPPGFSKRFRDHQLEPVGMGRFHLLVYEEDQQTRYALFDENHFQTAIDGLKEHGGTIHHLDLNVFPKPMRIEDMVPKYVED